jgi:hydrogenase maturation factor
MCQATIGKVTGVGKGSITIEYNGKKMELDSTLVKVVKGDYVLFSSGIAIEKVEKDDAKEAMGGCGCA